MKLQKDIPTSLKITAYLFMLIGFLPIIIAVISLVMSGSCEMGMDLFNIVCIFVGFGILSLNNSWRIVGIIILWINMLIFGCFTLFMGASSLLVSIVGSKIDKGLLGLINILMIVFISIMIYMLAVLSNRNTKALFKK